jgi:hypothetical protein
MWRMLLCLSPTQSAGYDDRNGGSIMNYRVNDVELSKHGYGFTIVDSRSKPLVFFEFEYQDTAKEAHKLISEVVGLAISVEPLDKTI